MLEVTFFLVFAFGIASSFYLEAAWFSILTAALVVFIHFQKKERFIFLPLALVILMFLNYLLLFHFPRTGQLQQFLITTGQTFDVLLAHSMGQILIPLIIALVGIAAYPKTGRLEHFKTAAKEAILYKSKSTPHAKTSKKAKKQGF